MVVFAGFVCCLFEHYLEPFRLRMRRAWRLYHHATDNRGFAPDFYCGRSARQPPRREAFPGKKNLHAPKGVAEYTGR